jgi:hypothetical protein
MKPFFLAITYFLTSGQPVEIDFIPAITANGNPVYEVMDCLEIADNERRKFFESLQESNGLFIDIRVECVRK